MDGKALFCSPSCDKNPEWVDGLLNGPGARDDGRAGRFTIPHWRCKIIVHDEALLVVLEEG